MKIEYSMKFALLALCLTFATTNAYALECTVDDPTGTPLNVRSRPNGPIVGALHNGAAVFVSDLILDGSGRRWAKIVPIEEGKSGWVFREYLMCTSASVPTDRVRAPACAELIRGENYVSVVNHCKDDITIVVKDKHGGNDEALFIMRGRSAKLQMLAPSDFPYISEVHLCSTWAGHCQN